VSAIVQICNSVQSGLNTSESVSIDAPIVNDLNLPRGLLFTAGILILLAEPIWLAIYGQLSLSMLTGSKPDCITLARLSNGTFQAVNDSFVRQFGFTREEAIGKTQRELGLWTDLSQAREVMRRLRNDGVITNVKINLRRKNGTILPVCSQRRWLKSAQSYA
jgi:PAS domain S-box-containing protein